MPEVRFFPGEGPVSVEQVGGKAASLIRMTEAALPVPPGAVLTVGFFAPWVEAITTHPAWQAVRQAGPDDWPTLCARVQARVPELLLTPAQQVDLEALASLPGDRFAVRSSSPEEDLAGASFAGGYETRLGVRRPDLLDAVRTCFASCLAARVLLYKRERGFDPFAPRIAVVVQQQIPSDVAGVAFSLDPVTNDYDHAVIDVSYGLGEAVVSGAVTPDHFVVDRVGRTVIERTLGAKAHRIDLDADGTVARDLPASSEASLDDDALLRVVDLLDRCEALYGVPVDIELAFADDRLWVLQARPITAWVPLPPDMVTAPGERRRLYMDLGLMGGLTINAPISPIGTSWMEVFAGQLVHRYLGRVPVELGPDDRLWFLSGARMYQDLSNVLWLSTPGLLAAGQRGSDPLVADTLEAVERRTYVASKRPAWLGLWLLWAYPRAVWRLRGMLAAVVRAGLAPTAARERYDTQGRTFAAAIAAIPEEHTLEQVIEENASTVIQHVLEHTMPGLVMAIGALGGLEALVPARLSDLRERVTKGFDGNVVVEMGVALYGLARLLPPEERRDPEVLAERLEQGQVPQAFREGWEDFLDRFGWRGPHEVDLAAPRYRDDPVLALRQVCSFDVERFDPAATQARLRREREEAYEELLGSVGWLRRLLIRPLYRVAVAFAGTRDTPKHDYLRFFALLRGRLRARGASLVEAGRLARADEVFGLTLADLADPDADLGERRLGNLAFVEKLRRLVRSFPPVIDSRGRILRPAPRPETPGELRGMPVSPGIVQGRAVVLEHPDQHPIRPGDVLVAHTTDPGWTPLFVNAGAVVLGVGGVLQHGAVVAREYGKPCVAGIPQLMDRLRTGQRVEVDGAAGVVRILGESPEGTC